MMSRPLLGPAAWHYHVAVTLTLKTTSLPFPYLDYRLAIGWFPLVKGGRVSTPSFPYEW